MEEQIVEKRELDAWEWVIAVAQKIINAKIRVGDHKEAFPEEESPLFKFLFSGHRDGVYPIFENRMKGTTESVSQINLFTPEATDQQRKTATDVKLTDISSENQNGKVIDTVSSETKKEE